MLIPSLFLVGFFFAQLGVLIGVRAEQFDDVSFAQTFVLQPLIFLGGVFYSASLLPEPFQTLTHFNPVYYMINLVRYGFLGYTEANIALSLLFLVVAAPAVRRQPPPVRAGVPLARVGSCVYNYLHGPRRHPPRHGHHGRRAARNVDFYTRVLGLRLVAKSVNQDDPTVYHLFYGDEGASRAPTSRSSSTRARRGGARARAWCIASCGASASPAALDFWEQRLAAEA